ncbi:MAG TPA: SRPBCC domain-containing protein [Candidatus Kapabacteria bacterium]|nr:SRPBCC domain-containing protein [Candidatus Kapabacteria bacterium]
MAASDQIRREIFINASPEHVFPFLVDPKQMTEWLAAASAESAAACGGIYRVVFDESHTARGEFVEVVPNSKVVFTWGWEGNDGPLEPGSSRVEITLEPRNGGTFLSLVHNNLPEPAVEGHNAGWVFRLGRLEAVAEGRTPVVQDPMQA